MSPAYGITSGIYTQLFCCPIVRSVMCTVANFCVVARDVVCKILFRSTLWNRLGSLKARISFCRLCYIIPGAYDVTTMKPAYIEHPWVSAILFNLRSHRLFLLLEELMKCFLHSSLSHAIRQVLQCVGLLSQGLHNVFPLSGHYSIKACTRIHTHARAGWISSVYSFDYSTCRGGVRKVHCFKN
jgi:hypothetical protein